MEMRRGLTSSALGMVTVRLLFICSYDLSLRYYTRSLLEGY